MSGKRIVRALATVAVAAGLAAGLNAAPANATAACSTVGAPYGVIGSYVRTTSGTYARSSCVKLNGVYRSGNAVTVTGGIRDTATDGKLAGVWVPSRSTAPGARGNGWPTPATRAASRRSPRATGSTARPATSRSWRCATAVA